MQWIKEVVMTKSIDELMTSRSNVARTDFPDYDMLDAIIASALKNLLDRHVHFRRRVSIEEQDAQKYNRFLRVRQIAEMIYKNFRLTGAYEAAQGLSDLFEYTSTERWRPGFRCTMGRSSTVSKRNT